MMEYSNKQWNIWNRYFLVIWVSSSIYISWYSWSNCKDCWIYWHHTRVAVLQYLTLQFISWLFIAWFWIQRKNEGQASLWMQLTWSFSCWLTESILPIKTLKGCRCMIRIKLNNGKILGTWDWNLLLWSTVFICFTWHFCYFTRMVVTF